MTSPAPVTTILTDAQEVGRLRRGIEILAVVIHGSHHPDTVTPSECQSATCVKARELLRGQWP